MHACMGTWKGLQQQAVSTMATMATTSSIASQAQAP